MKTKNKDYSKTICMSCGFDTRVLPIGIFWELGTCDYCGEDTGVTHSDKWKLKKPQEGDE